ncbi:Uncharacterised protein [Sphingobacterium daejeonense]|nr:Uncharacterised protein [Sphingobacterium daejeonense]
MRKTYLKKVPFIIMIIWTCLLSFGYAQGLQEIKGTVRDSDGPLSDVTITSISTGKSTKSDASGQFTIEGAIRLGFKIFLNWLSGFSCQDHISKPQCNTPKRR